MVVLYVGRSACGKTTKAKNLVKEKDFNLLVPYTTRPKREGEIDGVDYHFVTENEFFKALDEDKFIEVRSYDTAFGTWYYATPQFSPSKNMAGVADVKGALEIMNYCLTNNIKCNIMFIRVPEVIRELRAMKRGSFDRAEWERRKFADIVDYSDDKYDLLLEKEAENYDLFHVEKMWNYSSEELYEAMDYVKSNK